MGLMMLSVMLVSIVMTLVSNGPEDVVVMVSMVTMMMTVVVPVMVTVVVSVMMSVVVAPVLSVMMAVVEAPVLSVMTMVVSVMMSVVSMMPSMSSCPKDVGVTLFSACIFIFILILLFL